MKTLFTVKIESLICFLGEWGFYNARTHTYMKIIYPIIVCNGNSNLFSILNLFYIV